MDKSMENSAGKIKALCVSERRGTKKTEVDSAVFVVNYGIEGDAHAGDWHRQVSLLSEEKVIAFRERGVNVSFGDFGENIVASGFDFRAMPVGTLLEAGGVLLEITQIGKECHSRCAIYAVVGDCIMPREGVFARVLKGGEVKTGEELRVVKREGARAFQAAVITLSDRSSSGERDDISGEVLRKRLLTEGFEVAEKLVLPDEKEILKQALIRLSDGRQLDLILTTGGTGFASRDITPETTLEVMTRNAPGIAEGMRHHSLKITPNAMLSRSVSVIRGKTLIVNFPGSPKACDECFDFIAPVLSHAIGLLRNEIGDCAEKQS